jgi:hypothetical protein
MKATAQHNRIFSLTSNRAKRAIRMSLSETLTNAVDLLFNDTVFTAAARKPAEDHWAKIPRRS